MRKSSRIELKNWKFVYLWRDGILTIWNKQKCNPTFSCHLTSLVALLLIPPLYISLLWEQNASTCHFNIMNNITWYFVLTMLPFTFLRRDLSLLLMAPHTCTLTGNFTVVWIHLAWYFSFYLRQTRQWCRLLWLWNTGSCECVVIPQKGYLSVTPNINWITTT